MPRRAVIALLIAATLIAAAALLPRTRQGRGWLLSRATAVAGGLGYSLSYQGHGGNPWSGVTLRGAELVGPGIDLTVERLELDYFLPSLLTGELPVGIALTTVRGRIEVAGLALDGGSGGGTPVRPQLRDLALTDVAVAVDEVPFALPDLGLEGFSAAARPDGGGIDVAGVVASPEGRAPFAGLLTTAPLGLDLQVTGADLRLARHWWDGVLGGTLDASVRLDEGGIDVDGEVHSGAVTLRGGSFEDLSGPVRFRDLEVEANLAGRGLGGPLDLDGTVDIAARRWRGSYRASPALAEAAAWLSPAAGAALVDLDLEAELAVTGTIEGWREVLTEGAVTLSGALFGQAIADGALDYRVTPASGVEASGSARWAGGTVTAELRAQSGGFELAGRADELTLALAGVELDASGEVTVLQRDGAPSASFRVDLAGSPFERALQLELDGSFDQDGWQVFASGGDGFGAGIEGAAVLADGDLQGGVSVTGLSLPQLPAPVSLELAVDGSVEDLGFRVAVTAPGPLRFERAGVAAEIDPSGTVRGRFSGGAVTDLVGNLGPLALTGSADLATRALELAYTLSPTVADLEVGESTPLALTLAVERGSFGLAGSSFDHQATLTTGPLAFGPLDSAGLRGTLQQRSGEPWTFRGEQERLSATLAADLRRLDIRLARLPLTLAQRPLLLSGEATTLVADPLASLVATIEAGWGDLVVTASAESGTVSARASQAAGTTLAGVTLREPLALGGELVLASLELRATAETGVARLALAGPLRGGGELAGTLTTGQSVARVGLTPPDLGWSFEGDVDLRALALVGVAVDGAFSGRLAGRGASVQGRLDGAVTAPLGATVALLGRDDAVEIEATTELAGVAVQVAGRAWPDTALRAEIGELGELGALALDGLDLSGSGSFPELSLGPLTLERVPWQLSGSVAEAEATLRAADSTLTGRWSQGWSLSANVRQGLTLAGLPLTLDANALLSSDRPQGTVSGLASLTDGGDLRFEGSLEQLQLEGSLAAATVAELAGLDVVAPAGSVAFAGTLQPNVAFGGAPGAGEGPSFDVGGHWRGDGFDLALTARGRGSEAEITAVGSGIDARLDRDGVTLRLDAFAPETLLVDAPFAALASGDLARSFQGGWRGDLTVALTRPVAAQARLVGDDGALRLEASIADPRAEVTLAGRLLPDLDLGGRASALGGDLTAVVAASGSLGAPEVGGTLSLAAQSLAGTLDLPALAAALSVDLAARTLELRGDGLDLRAGLAGLDGSLELTVSLAGRPHLLLGEVSGPPSDPEGWLQLSGPEADGTLLYRAGRAQIELEASPQLLPLDDTRGIDLGRVALAGEVASSGAWRGEASTPLAFRGLEADLLIAAEGQGLGYRATARLVASSDGVELLAAEVAGAGSAASASVDLATLDVAALAAPFGLEASGDASGRLRLASEPPSYELVGALRGAFQGVPFTLEADLRSGAPASLTLGAYGVTLSAVGTPALARVNLSGSGVELAGELALEQGLALTLGGSAAGEALEAALHYDPGRERGTLRGTAAGVSLDAELRGPPSALALTATAVRRALPGIGGDARLEASLQRDGSALRGSLAAEISGGTLPATVALAGELFPATALEGAAQLPEPYGRLAVTVDTQPEGAGYLVGVGRAGLAAVVRLGSAFALADVTLAGSGSLPVAGTEVTVRSQGLSWQPAAGFSGRAELSATVLDVEATAVLFGRDHLDAEVALGRGGPLAGGTLRLSREPWSDRGLSGEIDYRLAAALFEGLPLPEDADVAGRVTVSGRWDDPELAASARLGGPLPAQGSWRYHSGQAELTLEGEGLTLKAEVERHGWRAHLEVADYPLEATLPWLSEPRLAASLDAEGDWSGALTAVIPSLLVTSANSSLEGRASVQLSEQVSYTAVLRVDADLTDLRLDTALRGRLRGPLAISGTGLELAATTIAGQLALGRIGLVAALAGASLDGTVQLSGRLDDPLVNLNLQGRGEAAGELRGTVQPSVPSARLYSDLRFGPLVTDLAVELNPTGFEAAGSVQVGEFGARVTSEEALLQLSGEGRAAGLQATIDVASRSAHVEAALDRLVAGIEGNVSLDAGLPDLAAAAPWLSGQVRGLRVAGLALADVTVRSDIFGGAIEIDSETLKASLDPSADLAWRAELMGLALTPELSLSGRASGSGTSGSAKAQLSGRLLGQPLLLQLDLELGEHLTLASEGDLLGGALALRADRDAAGWSGSLEVANARIGPEQVTLSGTLSGTDALPRLQATGSTGGPVPGTFAVDASAREVRVEGQAAPPGIADALAIGGTVWPAPELRIGPLGRPGVLVVRADAARPTAPLAFSGGFDTQLGPAALRLDAEGAGLVLTVRPDDGLRPAGLDLAGLMLTSDPLEGSLLALIDQVAANGLTLRGSDRAAGSVRLDLAGPTAVLTALRYDGSDLTLELDGVLDLAGNTRLSGTLLLREGLVPLTASPIGLPFMLEGGRESWSLGIAGEHGRLEAGLRPGERSGWLRGLLQVGGGTVEADLALTADAASGQLQLNGVRLAGVPGLAGFELTGRIDALGDRLSGDLGLDDLGGRGGVDLQLNYPLASVWAGAPSLEPLRVDARVRTFDIASLPPVAARAPNLTGAVSGVAQWRRGQVVGRLVAPELSVLGTRLASELEFNGGLAGLDLRGSVAGSPLTARLSTEAVSALLRFERFPLQVVAEAVTGGTDIAAEVTGVARLELPFATPGDVDLRVATELIRLERGGVVTSGNATFDLHRGSLTVERIAFSGEGRWEASGVVRSDRLEFSATAEDADFGPLLGLLPALAALDVGARGSMALSASGSLTQPTIALTGDELTVSLAGSSYRLEQMLVTLEERGLTVRTELIGIAPIVGQLSVRGGGQLSLAPLRLNEARFDISGDATVPVLGNVRELVGTVVAGGGEPPRLSAGGLVGNPFTIEGSLVPLDLRLRGDDLSVQAPNLLLASSVMDLDVTLRYRDGLDIGGRVDANEARFQLGIRPPATGGRSAGGGLERVRFAGIEIEAPGRIFFNESFAALEARASLRLGGSAAEPQLSGTATAVRGSVRFSGRDFIIEQGEASFEPTRGAYPVIDLTAVTSFDKARVVPAGNRVRFTEPRGSSRFEVVLRYQGAVERRLGGGISLDFDPELSSNARIEVDSEASLASGPRPLTSSELLALVTLGQLDISSILAGEGGLVTAVAQGALDTAVDLLVLAELQEALSAALGVEVVEIRTTALSSLLDGASDDPFGVSLRLGGYLSEEIFASFQIGSFNDADSEFAFTNEVRITYALGPVEFDLAGGVNVAADETLAPIPLLSSSVRYALSPALGLEAGLDLSSTRSQARFGVTLRW